ncbi:hypothetical protein C489_16709 [Natrinema versiforme JCM 10478]|uniref:Uncharacterized protein n=1 Tax=Natrinema versiforme JCM 10478 TaxID=1227496 RepID=L9XUV7_9EURY|nr:hypothetical protein C489_16709 [Natrinema versiforme JCM 10478]
MIRETNRQTSAVAPAGDAVRSRFRHGGRRLAAVEPISLGRLRSPTPVLTSCPVPDGEFTQSTFGDL